MIRLENVGVTFPDGTQALRGVTLDFDCEQFTAIIGLSGVEKSTMTLALA